MLPLKIKKCTGVQKLDAEHNRDHTVKETNNCAYRLYTCERAIKKTESSINVPPRSLFEYTDLERKHVAISLFI